MTGCVAEPEIKVDGVNDGDIYINDVTIHIDDQLAGDFTMSLNGQEIQNDHLVTENGDYELVINAKNYWKEKNETIQFKLDDVPPLLPAFYPELQEVYFQFVDFSIVEEAGVTYSATINGTPVSLNDRFEEEGTYTIKIQAMK